MLKPFEATLRKKKTICKLYYKCLGGRRQVPGLWCDKDNKTANTGSHFRDIYKPNSGYENCIDTEREGEYLLNLGRVHGLPLEDALPSCDPDAAISCFYSVVEGNIFVIFTLLFVCSGDPYLYVTILLQLTTLHYSLLPQASLILSLPQLYSIYVTHPCTTPLPTVTLLPPV